jgi:flagellar biosynthetic protein FliR
MITVTSADWNQWLAQFFFPFVRILAWLAVDPLLGNRAAPNTIRLGLALVLAVAVVPSLPPPPAVAIVSGDGVLLLLQQIAVGLSLGFALRIVFAALDMAGQFIGLQMGLSMASLYDPINGAQTPVLGQLLTVTSTLALFAMDGHHQVIAALWNSFRDVPVAATPGSGKGFLTLVHWGGAIFATGLHIALPITAALLAANLALGMMTRAAPQLNIFSVGFPITLGAGFLTLYFAIIYLPAYLERFWREALATSVAATRGLVGP